ncbi:MAG: hypothetical protein ACI36V_04955, partial [Coriobacteriales bacterium]
MSMESPYTRMHGFPTLMESIMHAFPLCWGQKLHGFPAVKALKMHAFPALRAACRVQMGPVDAVFGCSESHGDTST